MVPGSVEMGLVQNESVSLGITSLFYDCTEATVLDTSAQKAQV